MAINKVVYGGDTLIDLTSDTVTPPKLKIGAVAHAANGSAIEGELAGVYYGETAPDPSDAPVWIDPSGTADIKYKIYNSVTDLGLTIGSATITGALTALPESGILICDAGGFSSSEVPNIYGTIELKKRATARPVIQFFGRSEANGDWRMFCDANGTPSGTWVKISADAFVGLTQGNSLVSGDFYSDQSGGRPVLRWNMTNNVVFRVVFRESSAAIVFQKSVDGGENWTTIHIWS